MARSWSESRAVTKQAWGVIKQNPYMLAFPVVSAILAVIAVVVVGGAGIAALGWSTVEQSATTEEVSTGTIVIGVIILVIAAYLATLITQIFMGGLVKCADEELQGRDSSFGAGLSASFGRLPALLGWAGIQTAVGWLLSAVRGDGSNGNALVAILRLVLASLLAVAWSVITFFVLPLIILRGKGPLQAIKESVSVIRTTWGMQIAGGVRIGGMIALVAVLPGILFAVVGGFIAVAGTPALGVPISALGVIVIILAQVVISAMRAIFSVAMLHYVEDRQGFGPFDAAALQSAVRVK
ncbi:MAG: hypothetical protein H6526_03430 [Actinobacteria bacterium]|nr:hypothetical protein [Actinomycetota bacterium]MCB8997793.1 hypothetical protein [Actinomycetota bacterium]MCB9414313.1 hypothetical protein [Actinomycetota bacterium]MCB9424057.1 hypothetical protein [Actinomycetota bacterium]HRY09074.1 DUF6159 family protein [Candidatus Nanopelagicales bacterium]